MAEKRNKLQKLQETRREALRLLVATKEFKQDIESFRKRWSIPINGFKKSSEKVPWLDSLIKKTDTDLTKKDRKKKQWISSQTPIGKYQKMMQDLLLKHNLPQLTPLTLEELILYEDFSVIRDYSGPKVAYGNDENGQKIVLIKIPPNTTLEEIRSIWPIVQEVSKRTYKTRKARQRSLGQSSVAERVAELNALGLKASKIAEKIKEEFHKKSFRYTDVNKILHKIKRKTAST